MYIAVILEWSKIGWQLVNRQKALYLLEIDNKSDFLVFLLIQQSGSCDMIYNICRNLSCKMRMMLYNSAISFYIQKYTYRTFYAELMRLLGFYPLRTCLSIHLDSSPCWTLQQQGSWVLGSCNHTHKEQSQGLNLLAMCKMKKIPITRIILIYAPVSWVSNAKNFDIL